MLHHSRDTWGIQSRFKSTFLLYFLILKIKLIQKRIITFSESVFKTNIMLGRKPFLILDLLPFASLFWNLKGVLFVLFCSAFFSFAFHFSPSGLQIVLKCLAHYTVEIQCLRLLVSFTWLAEWKTINSYDSVGTRLLTKLRWSLSHLFGIILKKR